MKKYFIIILVLLAVSFLIGCSKKGSDNKVVIYTSAEDYRVTHMDEKLKEKFPQYNIVIEYLTTGNHAAKLNAELTKTEADITYDLEYGYLGQLEDAGVLAQLDFLDRSIYADDVLISDYFIPELRNGGSIIINLDVIAQKGLPEPTSYNDLLKPEYKNLISMANPKSSGTGYMFVKSLVNAWGEDKAFEYFDKLTPNVLQYTSSGSGPVNALLQGEVAIGLGMTAQAVTKLNEGANFKIVFFEEGSPYSMYGLGIIKGKESRSAVKEVFTYLYSDIGYDMVKLFYPEKIYKDFDSVIENYPQNIKYSDMSNDTIDEKKRLLDKWNY